MFEEHSLSAIVLKVLSAATAGTLPKEPSGVATGVPTVLMTTLSGEQHILGLAMAEAVLRSAGARTVNLGANLPIEDTVFASERLAASVVALSLSSTLSGRLALEQIRRLRRLLPTHVGVWIGGNGVAGLVQIPRGVSAFTCCRGIEAALARHTAHLPLVLRPTACPERGGASADGLPDAATLTRV